MAVFNKAFNTDAALMNKSAGSKQLARGADETDDYLAQFMFHMPSEEAQMDMIDQNYAISLNEAEDRIANLEYSPAAARERLEAIKTQ